MFLVAGQRFQNTAVKFGNVYDDKAKKVKKDLKDNNIKISDIGRANDGGMTQIDKSIKEREIKEKIKSGDISDSEGKRMISDLWEC